jgi:hypothetical protein
MEGVMAESTCLKCGGHSFEKVEDMPSNSEVAIHYIQCADCGGVVGVMDFYSVSELLAEQNKVLMAMAAKMGVRAKLETDER